MTRHSGLAALIVVVSAASAEELDTPERAVFAFESAYLRSDVDAALATWDFIEAARLIREAQTAPRLPLLVTSADLESLAAALRRDLANDIRYKATARFAGSQCRFTSRKALSDDLVQITESCVLPDGGESSQDLIVYHASSGWRVAQYPSPRRYERKCYTEASLGITVCSELDGNHVNAVKDGRVLWRRDSHVDWGVLPYRTLYPAIISIKEWSNSSMYHLEGYPHAVVVTYTSSEFGAVEVDTGKFQSLGRN